MSLNSRAGLIPLLALLPLSLVACDEALGSNDETDDSDAGGGGGGGGGNVDGGGGGGGGGGGLFGGGGRGESDDESGGGGGGGGDEGGGGGGPPEFPEVEPGPNLADAEEFVERLAERYCAIEACYGYECDVEQALEEYEGLINVFSNAPDDCLAAADSYFDCVGGIECTEDGYTDNSDACGSQYAAVDSACGEFLAEYGGYVPDYDYEGPGDDDGYGDDDLPPPDTELPCEDGGTFLFGQLCDGTEDCADGTDEAYCEDDGGYDY
jgi:hypothetical protein